MDWGPYILAVIGILGTIAASWVAQRREHHWEDERRWATDRRAMYTELMQASFDIAGPLQLEAAGKPTQPWRVDRDVAVERMLQAHAEIRLVGSPEVCDAALDLHRATIAVMQAAKDQSPSEVLAVPWAEARDAFEQAARRDLAV